MNRYRISYTVSFQESGAESKNQDLTTTKNTHTNTKKGMLALIDECLDLLENSNLHLEPFDDLEGRQAISKRINRAERFTRVVAGPRGHEVSSGLDREAEHI